MEAPMDWPLAVAKNKFSEVFERALKEGPQRISRRGKERVIVVAEAEYERGRRKKARPKQDFIEFLLSARGLGPLEIERDRSPTGRASARRLKF
jgi:prevent-host-death family protein